VVCAGFSALGCFWVGARGCIKCLLVCYFFCVWLVGCGVGVLGSFGSSALGVLV